MGKLSKFDDVDVFASLNAIYEAEHRLLSKRF